MKRLTKLVASIEVELQQSLMLNQLYMSQINQLEDDNISLCVRTEELKANG